MITLLRVLFGFIVACLIAGVVTVAFVVTPADIANLPPEAQPERLGNAGILALLAATHSAIFAFPFAIIAIGIAELSHVRSRIYYALVGIAIALGGFAAAYLNEVSGQPSILNGYALAAYLAVGVGRRAYLLAGRRSPRRAASAGTRRRRPPLSRRPTPSRSPKQPKYAHARIPCSRAIVLLRRSNQFSFLG